MSMGIIDIHSHILPGVDDGSVNWEEAIQMLTMAYEQGIRTIIATPHFSRHQNITNLQQLTQRLEDEAKKLDTEFRIFLGQEILYFESLVDYLNSKKALTLAGTRYVLVEFMPDVTYHNLYQWLRKILQAGYLPVIAHVERYPALRKEIRVQELISAGCYLQMNYRSLEGGLFDSTTRWCRKRILNHEIHFLGTDMHHSSYRTPEINKSLKWLKHNTDSDYMNSLTSLYAQIILENQPILNY